MNKKEKQNINQDYINKQLMKLDTIKQQLDTNEHKLDTNEQQLNEIRETDEKISEFLDKMFK